MLLFSLLVKQQRSILLNHHHYHYRYKRFVSNLNNSIVHNKTCLKSFHSNCFQWRIGKNNMTDHHHHRQHHRRHYHEDRFGLKNRFIAKNDYIKISKEVFDGIENFRPVVSLESTIITHGMKYPENLQTALNVESIIREKGAIPATIGIIDGKVYVGLQPKQLEILAEKASSSSFNDEDDSGDGVRSNYSDKIKEKKKIFKVSRGDLPSICMMGFSGGTTVSATSYLSNLCGIRVFVTGGIGGVHRGAEITMDISADLTELSRTPILVVSAGIKSILDIEKTLEVLETMGVCVGVYQGKSFLHQDHHDQNFSMVEFPSFYTPKSGFFVNYNFNDSHSVAQLIHTRDELGLDSGILLAVPNYLEQTNSDLNSSSMITREMEFQNELDQALQIALNEIREKKITGKNVTPYILSKISLLTNDVSLKLNQKLIENNAKVGAEIAIDYSNIAVAGRLSNDNIKNNIKKNKMSINNIDNGTSDSFPDYKETTEKNWEKYSSPSSCYGERGNHNKYHRQTNGRINQQQEHPDETFPVVIGASICDIITRIHSTNVMLNGSTYHGSIYTTLGGVGRNISDSIMRLGQKCLLITAVGQDEQGRRVSTNNSADNMVVMKEGIRFLNHLPTSSCVVTLSNNGECLMCIGDMRCHKFVDQKFISKFESYLIKAPIVITDGNIPDETMDYVCSLCSQYQIPVWHEPTDLNLADKIFKIPTKNLDAIKFISPNFYELQAMFHQIAHCKDHRNIRNIQQQQQQSKKLDIPRNELIEITAEYGFTILNHFKNLHSIIATLGKHGLIYIGPENHLDLTQNILFGQKLLFKDKNSRTGNDPNGYKHFPQDSVSNIVNVSGAGDCLVGATIYGLLNGKTLKESLILGLKAAKYSLSSDDTVPNDLWKINH